MWSNSKARRTLSFPELEKRLYESRQEARRESDKLHKRATNMMDNDSRDKIISIRKRNKKRTILVLREEVRECELVSSLLDANSNATVTYADTTKEAIKLMQEKHFDMLYIVKKNDIAFFFSVEEKYYVDKYSGLIKTKLKELAPYHNGAEIIIIYEKC